MSKKRQRKALHPPADLVGSAAPPPVPIVAVDEPKVVRANINREMTDDPQYVSLYANDVQVQLTPWDIRLILGQIASVPTEEKPTITIRQIGEVRLSPQLAKRLTMIMIGQLKHYEKTVGPIPIPAD